MQTDYYQTLQVRPGATRMEINRAYLRLAGQYHGVRGLLWRAQAQKIQDAYEVLSDPLNRGCYDLYINTVRRFPDRSYPIFAQYQLLPKNLSLAGSLGKHLRGVILLFLGGLALRYGANRTTGDYHSFLEFASWVCFCWALLKLFLEPPPHLKI